MAFKQSLDIKLNALRVWDILPRLDRLSDNVLYEQRIQCAILIRTKK